LRVLEESHRFDNFPPFWYELGSAYQNDNNYSAARKAYTKFEQLQNNTIITYDKYYVELAKNMISLIAGSGSTEVKNKQLRENKNEVYNVKITNLEYGFSFDIPSNFLEVGEESFKNLELKDNTLYSFSIDDYTNFHVILMSLKEDNIDSYIKFTKRKLEENKFEILNIKDNKKANSKIPINEAPDRLYEMMRNKEIPTPLGRIRIELSIGYAEMSESNDYEECLKRADLVMYEKKKSMGRRAGDRRAGDRTVCAVDMR